MSNIEKTINRIELQALYRSTEITQMFSQLSLLYEKEDESLLEKYFMARSIVVFSYGTLEKFIKIATTSALTEIIDNKYFFNNTRDFLCILKSKNNPIELFNLVMFYKNNNQSENTFKYNNDKGYFEGRSSINSTTIANIVEILGLNEIEPLLRIPRITIDSLCNTRMMLAHGDYYGNLKDIFNIERSSMTKAQIDELIFDVFRLTESTKDDLITFIKDFKEKIVSLLKKIDEYNKVTNNNSDS